MEKEVGKGAEGSKGEKDKERMMEEWNGGSEAMGREREENKRVYVCVCVSVRESAWEGLEIDIGNSYRHQ